RMFCFHDTAATEISTLSLHDVLPISAPMAPTTRTRATRVPCRSRPRPRSKRSEEHTSELQSLAYLECRLLLETQWRLYISQILYQAHVSVFRNYNCLVLI